MKARSNSSHLLLCCALVLLADRVMGKEQPSGGPIYAGKSLSSWLDDLLALPHLREMLNTNYSGVRAVRAMGPNAIPWLLSEMTNRSPFEAGDKRPYQKPNEALQAAPGLVSLFFLAQRPGGPELAVSGEAAVLKDH